MSSTGTLSETKRDEDGVFRALREHVGMQAQSQIQRLVGGAGLTQGGGGSRLSAVSTPDAGEGEGVSSWLRWSLQGGSLGAKCIQAARGNKAQAVTGAVADTKASC